MNTGHLSSIFSERLGVAEFKLFLNSDWASQHEGHRQMLRNAIGEYLTALGTRTSVDSKSVTDLAVLPEAEGHSLSISHCKRAGGFVVAPRCNFVGFDLEINRRLDGVRLGLVSVDESELRAAPTPAAFWTAKEAAFKCLRGPTQPRGLKDIRVANWKKEEATGIYHFEVVEIDGARSAQEISGLVVDDGEMSYAVCVRQDRGERDALVIN